MGSEMTAVVSFSFCLSWLVASPFVPAHIYSNCFACEIHTKRISKAAGTTSTFSRKTGGPVDFDLRNSGAEGIQGPDLAFWESFISQCLGEARILSASAVVTSQELQCSHPCVRPLFFPEGHHLLCLSRAAASSSSLLKSLCFICIIFSSSAVTSILLGLLQIILWSLWLCWYLFNFLYITKKTTHISALPVVHRTASHRCSVFSKAFIPQDPVLRLGKTSILSLKPLLALAVVDRSMKPVAFHGRFGCR